MLCSMMAINDDLLYEVNDKGERVIVKSLETQKRAHLRFSNRTSRPINVWWRDFQGRRKHYFRLNPGAYHDVDSYLTHPWEFTDVSTKERYVINNKYIFRAPENVGGMLYRTNWNISVGVRTLRYTAMLALATLLPDPECVPELNLPRVVATELQDLVNVLHSCISFFL